MTEINDENKIRLAQQKMRNFNQVMQMIIWKTVITNIFGYFHLGKALSLLRNI